MPTINSKDLVEVIYGMDIKIDASFSRDEKFLLKKNDLDLLFSWEGPIRLSELLKKYKIPLNENKIFLIKAEEYKKYIQNNEFEFELKLILKKNNKTANKIIKVIIKKPKEIQETPNSNKEKIKRFSSDLIKIEIDKMGIKDLIIKYSILDNSFSYMRFKNIWTIKNFPFSKYYNGQNEIKLRLNKDDLLIGKNIITLKLIDNLTEDVFLKDFIYEKTNNPYGGNCVVSPPVGFSLFTDFTFRIDNWKSSSVPLSYSLRYSNSEDILIDITKGGFYSGEYTTNEIPVGYNIYLFITDIEGKSTSLPCSPKVNVNKNLPDIKEFLNSIYDPSRKMLLMDIYETNKKTNQNENTQIDINNKIDILDSFFSITTEEKFLQEYYNIISQIIKITKMNLDSNSIDQILGYFKIIIKYIDSLVEDFKKVDCLYLIASNLNKKFTTLKGKNKKFILFNIIYFFRSRKFQ